MTLQADDFEAINTFFMTTPINTPAAQELKTAWIMWYQGLGWWDKNMDITMLRVAKNKRNDFNLANAKSEPEKQQVKQVLRTGITTEEARGEVRAVDTDGYYAVSEPIMRQSTKIRLIGYTALASLGGAFLWVNGKRVRLF